MSSRSSTKSSKAAGTFDAASSSSTTTSVAASTFGIVTSTFSAASGSPILSPHLYCAIHVSEPLSGNTHMVLGRIPIAWRCIKAKDRSLQYRYCGIVIAPTVHLKLHRDFTREEIYKMGACLNRQMCAARVLSGGVYFGLLICPDAYSRPALYPSVAG